MNYLKCLLAHVELTTSSVFCFYRNIFSNYIFISHSKPVKNSVRELKSLNIKNKKYTLANTKN